MSYLSNSGELSPFNENFSGFNKSQEAFSEELLAGNSDQDGQAAIGLNHPIPTSPSLQPRYSSPPRSLNDRTVSILNRSTDNGSSQAGTSSHGGLITPAGTSDWSTIQVGVNFLNVPSAISKTVTPPQTGFVSKAEFDRMIGSIDMIRLFLLGRLQNPSHEHYANRIKGDFQRAHFITLLDVNGPFLDLFLAEWRRTQPANLSSAQREELAWAIVCKLGMIDFEHAGLSHENSQTPDLIDPLTQSIRAAAIRLGSETNLKIQRQRQQDHFFGLDRFPDFLALAHTLRELLWTTFSNPNPNPRELGNFDISSADQFAKNCLGSEKLQVVWWNTFNSHTTHSPLPLTFIAPKSPSLPLSVGYTLITCVLSETPAIKLPAPIARKLREFLQSKTAKDHLRPDFSLMGLRPSTRSCNFAWFKFLKTIEDDMTALNEKTQVDVLRSLIEICEIRDYFGLNIPQEAAVKKTIRAIPKQKNHAYDHHRITWFLNLSRAKTTLDEVDATRDAILLMPARLGINTQTTLHEGLSSDSKQHYEQLVDRAFNGWLHGSLQRLEANQQLEDNCQIEVVRLDNEEASASSEGVPTQEPSASSLTWNSLNESEKADAVDAWKALTKRFVEQPRIASQLRDQLRGTWMKEGQWGLDLSNEEAQKLLICRELKKNLGVRRENGNRGVVLATIEFLRFLGVNSPQSTSDASTSRFKKLAKSSRDRLLRDLTNGWVSELIPVEEDQRLDEEMLACAWESFSKLKFSELDGIAADPAKYLASLEEMKDGVVHPSILIQQRGFPVRTQLFPLCLIQSRYGALALASKSIEGTEQPILEGIWREVHPDACAGDELESLGLVDPKRVVSFWKAVSEQWKSDQPKLIPLIQEIHPPPGHGKSTRKTTELDRDILDAPPRLPKERRLILEEGVDLLQQHDPSKSRKKKGKQKLSEVRSGSATRKLSELAEAELPEWIQSMLETAGGQMTEYLKQMIQTYAAKANRALQLMEAGGEDDRGRFPALPQLLNKKVAAPAPMLDILRDYQKEALHCFAEWKANGINGVFANSPGLGKTVQGCEVIAQSLALNPSQPCIVIAPMQVKEQWKSEFTKHYLGSVARAAVAVNDDDTLLSITRALSLSQWVDLLGLERLTPEERRQRIIKLNSRLAGNHFLATQPTLSLQCSSPEEIAEFCQNLIRSKMKMGLNAVLGAFPLQVPELNPDECAQRIRTYKKLKDFGALVPKVCKTSTELNDALRFGAKGLLVTHFAVWEALAKKGKPPSDLVDPAVVIIDEAHELIAQRDASKKQAFFQQLLQKWSCPKVALTATPVENSLYDLMDLLVLLNPEKVKREWMNTFYASLDRSLRQEILEGYRSTVSGQPNSLPSTSNKSLVVDTALQLLWLQTFLRQFINRNSWESLGDQVDQSIKPVRHQYRVLAPFTDEQTHTYTRIRKANKSFLQRSALVASLTIHPDLVQNVDASFDYVNLPDRDNENIKTLAQQIKEDPSTLELDENKDLLDLLQPLHSATELYFERKCVAMLVKTALQARGQKSSTMAVIGVREVNFSQRRKEAAKKLRLIYQGGGKSASPSTLDEKGINELVGRINKMTVEECREWVERSGSLRRLFLDQEECEGAPNLIQRLRNNQRAVLFVDQKKHARLVQAVALKLFEKELNGAQERVTIVNSDVTQENRSSRIRQFKQLDGAGLIILMPKSGGAGLNFTKVDLLIKLSRLWTFALDEQTDGRIMRREKGDTSADRHIVSMDPQVEDTEHMRMTIEQKRLLSELLLRKNPLDPKKLSDWTTPVIMAAHAMMRSTLTDCIVPEITARQIFRQVAKWFKMERGDLRNPYSRLEKHRVARQLGLLLCRELLKGEEVSKGARAFDASSAEWKQVDSIDLQGLLESCRAIRSEQEPLPSTLEEMKQLMVRRGPRAVWESHLEDFCRSVEEYVKENADSIAATYEARKKASQPEPTPVSKAPAKPPEIATGKRPADSGVREKSRPRLMPPPPQRQVSHKRRADSELRPQKRLHQPPPPLFRPSAARSGPKSPLPAGIPRPASANRTKPRLRQPPPPAWAKKAED